MTSKELIEYLIKETLKYFRSKECPPDTTEGCNICKEINNCKKCWIDFLNNRYKEFKLEDKKNE